MKVTLSVRAERQAATLARHYVRLGRYSAIRNLSRALEDARDALGQGRMRVLAAPVPYPELAQSGVHWIHSGRYWLSFPEVRAGLLITAVYFDEANIPARVKRAKS